MLSFAGLLVIAACGDEGADAPQNPATSTDTGGAVTVSSVSGTPTVSSAAVTTGTSAATTSVSSATTGEFSTTGTAAGGASGSASISSASISSASISSGSVSQPLSFEVDIWPVYEQTCEPPFVYPGGTIYSGCTDEDGCHGGARAGAGLRMPDAATAYAALIDVPSNSNLCDGTLRVVAGNPDQSCLILFYEGRLKDELDWVDEAEIDLMRAWILQGAAP